jgi:predicted dehydrogenase
MSGPQSNSGKRVENSDKRTPSVKALVVGYGSIGQRHVRVLMELGYRVAVMSRRSIAFEFSYSELSEALSAWQPGYVVIANRTSEHFQTVEALVQYGFRGFVLIEKPLFENPAEIPEHNFSHVGIGYNLRCHPLLTRLKSFLNGAGNMLTAHVYVGAYLPLWRPDSDYRQSYSAKRKEGGGVLRDLSHELDYVLWLFGHWQRLTAHGGHFSKLEIDTEDAFCLIMETECCPLVTIHLNYLDRVPRREIIVNTNRHTCRVDLIKNKITFDGVEESATVDRDGTYRVEHQAMLGGNIEDLCTVKEGMETLLTIQAAEKVASSHIWIGR